MLGPFDSSDWWPKQFKWMDKLYPLIKELDNPMNNFWNKKYLVEVKFEEYCAINSIEYL
jgi:hypothetical protein